MLGYTLIMQCHLRCADHELMSNDYDTLAMQLNTGVA